MLTHTVLFYLDSHIGNSRDTSFEQLILKQTGGRGVDIVLNSLSKEKVQASLRCLAKGGKFLEIGKYDLSNESPLHLQLFEKNVSFHGVHLDSLFHDIRYNCMIHRLIKDGINNGYVKPLLRTCFGHDELETAFRFLASGKHIGKVLIKIRDEEKEKFAKASVKFVKANPRYLRCLKIRCDLKLLFVYSCVCCKIFMSISLLKRAIYTRCFQTSGR